MILFLGDMMYVIVYNDAAPLELKSFLDAMWLFCNWKCMGLGEQQWWSVYIFILKLWQVLDKYFHIWLDLLPIGPSYF